MSRRSTLTRDLNESIRALLGKQIKILLKIMAKMEIKSDKTENRVLVFSRCRLFVLTAKVPTRIDFHFHYLEIQAIESVKKPYQLCITVSDKLHTFYSQEENSGEVDHMVVTLVNAVKSIFPGVPFDHVIRKVEVVPAKRVQQLGDLGSRSCSCSSSSSSSSTSSTSSGLCHGATSQELLRDAGPCGGFSIQYACMCDLHGLPYREEVAWDVDTIYLSHDTRELCLRDFDHLDQKDLVPIISALEYNTWFTKFRSSNVRLSHEAVERVLHVMKKSLSLEELHLDNIGAKWDFAHKLSLALIANNYTPLHTLDLSYNMIEDKGVSSLCGTVAKLAKGASHLGNPIAKIPKGLVHLNLAHCGLSSKGVNQLAHALTLNKFMPTTLTFLNLSGNSLRDEVNNLCNFLAQPNAITHLDLSGTDCVLDTVFGALLRGCTTNLCYLNLSRNAFSTKKAKETPPSFKQFFTSTLCLRHLNMSSCKLPLEALKNLLLGLACNESTTEVDLDISNNNLGSQGAHVLESCIHGVRCLGTLDISDNNMDVDLAGVVTSISKNKSIKHLNVGRNLNGVKAKHVAFVMEAVVQMIQEEDCVLQSLSIADSKLKSDLFNLINALGSNHCLQSIDISGNMMGDGGARLLAKALQINSRLRSIIYDRNNITLQGYSDITYALESNYTVRYMPFPIHDVMPCMKAAPERTEALMRRIQELLHRNVSPKKYSHGQAFRLQQGFLLSSTQQMVDRLVVQTQDTIRTLRKDSHDSNNDINLAEGLIQDADKSKQLLTRLQEVVQRREEAGNPVDMKLRQIAEELHTVISNYLQGTVEAMIKCAEDQCPHTLVDKVQGEIRKTCQEKSALSQEFVQACIVEQAGTDVMNKVNELNLAVAAHVSDRIIDEVIESLSRSYKSLAGDVNKKRASTPDVLKMRTRLVSSSDSSGKGEQDETVSLGDNASQKSDQSPMKLEYLNLATPQLSNKRKSLHGRKLRPKSVVDSVEGLSADDIPDLLPGLPKSAEESLDSLSELPSSTGQQLQHLGKARPKKAKTRAPSRPMVRPSEVMIEGTHDLEEGLDSFFRPGSVTPTTPLVSPSSEESTLPLSAATSVENSPYHLGSRDDKTPQDTSGSFDADSPSPKEEDGADKSSKGAADLASKSRSVDSLEKASPMAWRRSQESGPLPSKSPVLDKKEIEGDTKKGMPKIGVGVGGNVLAEMKARQEKRASLVPKPADEPEKSPSPTALSGVKLRSTGLAESLKSPTNGFPKTGTGKEEKEGTSPTSKSAGAKVRPPPIAPKPRPWSMISVDRKSGEFIFPSDGSNPNSPEWSETQEDSMSSSPPGNGEKKSVRELAASLNKQQGGEGEAARRKSGSLPHSPPPPDTDAPRRHFSRQESPKEFVPTSDLVALRRSLKKVSSTDTERTSNLDGCKSLPPTLGADEDYSCDDIINV